MSTEPAVGPERTRVQKNMALRIEDVGLAVREAEYAVRGPVPARAGELERAGRKVVYCNIGNPQSLGQRPLTWVREVVALSECPSLLERVPAGTFAADVVEAARQVARGTAHGLGAYTDSKGYRFVREAVAAFITTRDGIPADPEAIYLTDGASKGAQNVLRLLISGPQDGILVPVPQYPLYSATIRLYDGAHLPYALDEGRAWALSAEALERTLADARARGIRPRALVVINPGNPTGAVLDRSNVEMILDLARRHGLAILADEVYQDNLWRAGDRFVSFASVLEQRGIHDVSLFSFHSVSKGYLGECGHRGGYLEARNVPPDVLDELTKLQSIGLCANSVGQIVTWLLVRPPRPGDPSFATWDGERRGILEALRRKAGLVEKGLSGVPGIQVNPVTGAMYAFPRIELPPGSTDLDWCMGLLEETGICVVPGSGFGQAEGTWHFRTTILPPEAEIEGVVRRIAEFHVAFRARGGKAAPRP